MSPFRVLLRTLIGFLLLRYCMSDCYRKPQGATGDRSPVDENYQILIEGNPSTYLPGQMYNLSLSCAPDLKFLSFTMLLEAEDPSSQLTGELQIIDQAETKFSEHCTNLVESSNNNIKHKVDVGWIAPDHPDSGCVLFKAAVLQHRNVWFMDDGYLTKRLCREHVDEVHSQSPAVDPCCACEEAKYEIVIERQWNRNTHPKGFPRDAWRTRLGMLIGASHSVGYKFWNYGEKASLGLQELAEHGASDALEMEIKNHSLSGHIRTIIKAPEIKYKLNAVSKTLATVRVGPVHHMISFVSKINPSPDWILGVAALELCLANCTWVERKELKLYPWDVGTDAGPEYMSADQAQKPPDVIRRITSTFPSDERSPFYDRSGAPIKPLAILTVTRKRTYGRCDEDIGENMLECATYPWNEWSECSAKCSRGVQYRERKYKDEAVAFRIMCNRTLREERDCQGACLTTAECELKMWSDWSACSNACGKGTQTRTRGFVNAYAADNCQKNGPPIELQQTRTCEGRICGGNISPISFYGNNDQDMMSNAFDDSQRPGIDFSDRDIAGNLNFGSDDLRSEITRPTSMRYNAGMQYGTTNNMNNMNNMDNINNMDNTNTMNNMNTMNSMNNMNSISTMNNMNSMNNMNNMYRNKPYVDDSQQLAGDLNKPLYGDRDTYPSEYDQTSSFKYDQNSDQSMLYTTARTARGPSYTTASYGIYNTPSPFDKSNQLYGNINDNRDLNAEENFCLNLPVASLEPCNANRIFNKNFWFYDARDMMCKIFTTDNCDLNRNKFHSLSACEETCKGQQNLSPDYQDLSRGGYRRSSGVGMNQDYQTRGTGINQGYQNRDSYGASAYDAQRRWPYK